MKPVVIDLFKGHKYLPAFAVMQSMAEFTTPEIAVEIKTDAPVNIPSLHTTYEEINADSDSIQGLLFEKVIPYYLSIMEKHNFRALPRITALIITHCPFNGEEK